jgi:L-asparagine transporter-like permease
VSSVGLRTGMVPRWLVVVGLVAGLGLLLSPPLTRWAQLVFPAWVLLVSCYILVAGRSGGSGATART